MIRPNRSRSSRRLTRAAFSKPLRAASLSPSPIRVGASMNLVMPPGEKNISGLTGPPEEHVVVGVQEVLGQAGDVVQLAFDGLRIVGRQHRRVGEELLAAHDRDARVLGQPGRPVGVGGDEDPPHPRREHVQPNAART